MSLSGNTASLNAAWPGNTAASRLARAIQDDLFSRAVFVSAIVHIAVIFGLQFKQANPALLQFEGKPVEVVLVNSKSKKRPIKADVLAQHHLDGGGNVAEMRRARSPLPQSQEDQSFSPGMSAREQLQAVQRQAETARQQQRNLEQQVQNLMQQQRSDYRAPTPRETPPQVEPTPPTRTPGVGSLMQRSLEMARLQAGVEEKLEAYQQRPRRLFVGAHAEKYVFARYVDDWRLKVERWGNQNYPEAAKREGIHGSLILTVNIRADGSLESVQVYRSSGSRILDQAAIRIVESAAPYAAFTTEMRKEVDVLGITRTWTFTRSDQLTSQ